MKPIRTPEDHRELLDEIASLMGAEPGTAEADRLEILAVLASEYEKRALPAESDPVDLLNVVMRGKGLSQAELSEVLGSRARASEVLSRRRNLSAEMIERLSRAWSIPKRLLAAPFPLARRRPSGTLISILVGGFALLASAAAAPFVVYGRNLPDVAPLVRDPAATDVTRLPPHVVQAFIAGEDKAFLSHGGYDAGAIVRASSHNIAGGWAHPQGGSTLTQQLLKNTLLAGEPRSLRRKVREVLLSREIEDELSKDRILGLYLSHVYFGAGSYGIAAASRHYFGRAPDQLSVGQAAYLAALVDAPDARRFDRPANRERSVIARNEVLGRMARVGFVTPATARAAAQERLW
jgi:penicillin-binding protein 1A